MTGFSKYTMKRKGKCRGCNASIAAGTEVVYTYTSVNPGMHIYICDTCADGIAKLAISKYNNIQEFGDQWALDNLKE